MSKGTVHFISYKLLVDGLHKRQLFSCPCLPGSHPICSWMKWRRAPKHTKEVGSNCSTSHLANEFFQMMASPGLAIIWKLPLLLSLIEITSAERLETECHLTLVYDVMSYWYYEQINYWVCNDAQIHKYH